MPNEIFINYRRDDAEGYALAIINQMKHVFPEGTIFRDISTIQPGEDFPAVIHNALSTCKVCLVLINKSWQNILMQRAATNETDYVITEIKEALERGIYVIPIIINHSAKPHFPSEIAQISEKQFFNLDDESFDNDIGTLIKLVKSKIDVGKKDRKAKSIVWVWLRSYAIILALAGLITYLIDSNRVSSVKVGLWVVGIIILALFIALPFVLISKYKVKPLTGFISALVADISLGIIFSSIVGSEFQRDLSINFILLIVIFHASLVSFTCYLKRRSEHIEA